MTNSSSLKKVLAALILCTLVLSSYAQTTVTSKSGGGLWFEPTTWVGNVVPGENQNVVINGLVAINGYPTCQSITINSGSILQNDKHYNTTLKVHGSVNNHGVIRSHPTSGYLLYIDAYGSIYNSGSWHPYQTTFVNTSTHTISQAQNSFFEGRFFCESDKESITLTSNVEFRDNFFDFRGATVNTGTYNLKTSSYMLDDAVINANSTFELTNTQIAYLKINGNYSISGSVYLQNGVELSGTITLKGTIHNDKFYNTTLNVFGKLMNESSFTNHPTSGYHIVVNIFDDLENRGIWSPRSTYFKSDEDQRIKLTAGKNFEGYFENTDSIGDIIMESDVSFIHNTWRLNNASLKTNGFQLNTDNYLLEYGKIVSNDKMKLDSSSISYMKFFGDYKLDGKVFLRYNNIFFDKATILDTMHNDKHYNTTLRIAGDIINEGTIINHPTSGYLLDLDVESNIFNKGVWKPRHTLLELHKNQEIKMSAGTMFEGNFSTNDTVGNILLGSEVLFSGVEWNLKEATLLTNNFDLNTINCYLSNGKISSNDTLNLDKSMLSNLRINGDYFLDGRIHIRHDNVFSGNATILDTMYNDRYYNSTLKFYGNVDNKGIVTQHPESAYRLYIDLYKNLHNQGIWQPYSTSFAADAIQEISQDEGYFFRGYFNNRDTLGSVILKSDVSFTDNTWNLGWSKVVSNGFNLFSNNYLFEKGKIESNDTLFLKNSLFSSIDVLGDVKIKESLYLRYDNVFHGTTTVIDSLINDKFYNTTVSFDGSLINEGAILNNPGSSYKLDLKVSGNITNNKTINVDDIYLTGSGERNIGGNGMINADFNVADQIILIDKNKLSNLNISGDGTVTLKKDASLTLFSELNDEKVINYGKITVVRDIDNVGNKTYDYFTSSVSTRAGTNLSELSIDHYGKQQHRSTKGVVNSWWRLRSSPQDFADTLNWLKLKYAEEDLNGSLEDSLKVFYSPNAGLSWKRIKKDFSVNVSSNTITVENTPSYGHYILSSTGTGVINFEPYLETAEPKWGGNSGYLTMYLFGAGFKAESKVILRADGLPDIVAEKTWLTDPFGESMNARFDFQDKALSTYDVIIETPGSETQMLEDNFILTTGQRSDPWSNLTGRDRFLLNRWQTFRINYGNTANTDALATVLVFVINDYPDLEVIFPDLNVILPQAIVDLGPDYTRYSELDLYYVTDSLSGYEGQNMRVYPFVIPYIPAGSTESTRVRVKLTGEGSLNMDSWILDPLFEDIPYDLKSKPMPSEVRACITAAAMKAYAGAAIGAIPGMACWSIIDKTVDPIGYITPESIKPESGKKTWGSWLWSGFSIMTSAVQCGASFVPGVGTAVSLGIGMVGVAVDIKDGYDTNEACWRKFRKKSKNKFDSRGVSSFDPNEIVGPRGYTEDHYISRNEVFDYTIFFENKKTAGASALEVFVYDTLDKAVYDFETFSFNSITFADTSVAIQSHAHEFEIMVDMYPKRPIIVQVHGKLDTVSGLASWDFHSLDRVTMELTEDPDMGFLLPNVTSPEGEGNVTFSVELKETVQHDDEITNYATIVFDFNKPIVTNIHTNLIDDRVPSSWVTPLDPVQEDSIFTVSWQGEDLGSDILNYNIFMSKNDSTYVLWKIAREAGEAQFVGSNNCKYSFFSIAADSVGFVEALKTSEEASTVVEVETSARHFSANELEIYPVPAGDYCILNFSKPVSDHLSISIEDLSGRVVERDLEKISKGDLKTFELDLKSLNNGIYFIRLESENTTTMKKIIVKK